MYICHMKEHTGFKGIIVNPGGELKDGGGQCFLGRVYRALRAVFHIIDRQLDLSLLSDHRVLKEGHAAQVDRVTGALQTKARQGEVRPRQSHRRKERSGRGLPL